MACQRDPAYSVGSPAQLDRLLNQCTEKPTMLRKYAARGAASQSGVRWVQQSTTPATLLNNQTRPRSAFAAPPPRGNRSLHSSSSLSLIPAQHTHGWTPPVARADVFKLSPGGHDATPMGTVPRPGEWCRHSNRRREEVDV